MTIKCLFCENGFKEISYEQGCALMSMPETGRDDGCFRVAVTIDGAGTMVFVKTLSKDNQFLVFKKNSLCIGK